jgi:hypothetical protein
MIWTTLLEIVCQSHHFHSPHSFVLNTIHTHRPLFSELSSPNRPNTRPNKLCNEWWSPEESNRSSSGRRSDRWSKLINNGLVNERASEWPTDLPTDGTSERPTNVANKWRIKRASEWPSERANKGLNRKLIGLPNNHPEIHHQREKKKWRGISWPNKPA